jgi:hypothetical protein
VNKPLSVLISGKDRCSPIRGLSYSTFLQESPFNHASEQLSTCNVPGIDEESAVCNKGKIEGIERIVGSKQISAITAATAAELMRRLRSFKIFPPSGRQRMINSGD